MATAAYPVFGDGRLGDFEAELEQFAIRGAPSANKLGSQHGASECAGPSPVANAHHRRRRRLGSDDPGSQPAVGSANIDLASDAGGRRTVTGPIRARILPGFTLGQRARAAKNMLT